jgi:hypothetical protein
MTRRSTFAATPRPHPGCHRPLGDGSGSTSHARSSCVRDMDQRIADAVRRDGLTRGAALALYGEVMETHPEDPCSARDRLAEALGELVLA